MGALSRHNKRRGGSESRPAGRRKAKVQQLPRWASARTATRYVVAIDDSGQKAVRPSAERRCFFLGGLILPVSQLERLRHAWTSARGEQEEVKARTYVSSLGWEEHQDWAEAMLSVEMNHWKALPFWIAFDKIEAGPDITLTTRKGGRRIDVSKGITLMACSLAVHLRRVDGRVETVFIDHISSTSEESMLQEEWRRNRRGMDNGLRRRLPKDLSFVDSKSAPEIHVADVLAGLLRAAHEERRPIAPAEASAGAGPLRVPYVVGTATSTPPTARPPAR
jgi:hypothetical protein